MNTLSLNRNTVLIELRPSEGQAPPQVRSGFTKVQDKNSYRTRSGQTTALQQTTVFNKRNSNFSSERHRPLKSHIH